MKNDISLAEDLKLKWRGNDLFFNFSSSKESIINNFSVIIKSKVASSNGINLTFVIRSDDSIYWYAETRFPEILDPGDGYTHSISFYGDTAQQALDGLRTKLEEIKSWIDNLL